MHQDADTLGSVRRALLALLVFGLIGIGAELLLLGHVDGLWQIAPLALVGAALAVLAWHAIRGGGGSIRALQAIMLGLAASGGAGVLLHYRGNVEFEVERSPGLTGLALFREAMTGATPALAPGTMCLLGLIGLVYAHGHPARRPGAGLRRFRDRPVRS